MHHQEKPVQAHKQKREAEIIEEHCLQLTFSELFYTVQTPLSKGDATHINISQDNLFTDMTTG